MCITGTLQSFAEHMNPLAVDYEHRSAIDKHWKEGVDYFRMEPSVICHDGESIQVRNQADHFLYILIIL